jgi:formylmethanofuran dehydrogenase subunit B
MDGEAPADADLVSLTQRLNGTRRAALSTLRGGGNRSGADACLTSQTGYPMAVDFSRGFPRYRPFDGTAAARLAHGEVDALLVVGAAASLPADVIAAIAGAPHAVIGPRASEGPLASGVAAIDTGVAGIHEAGTVLRMDDVPLPVATHLDGPPDTRSVLRSLRDLTWRPSDPAT